MLSQRPYAAAIGRDSHGSAGDGPVNGRWSPFHLRLHRLLLQDPLLLPPGTPLLLAVSGGQDSMALTGLLLDLRRLHGWRLHLWHGDHGWRRDSAHQAGELAAWARTQALPITVERPQSVECGDGEHWKPERWPSEGGAAERSEASARQWRYGCLAREAQRLGIGHVLTGHTASDRAETLLLHLARGSHRRGLASLRLRRPLTERAVPAGGMANGVAGGVALLRPLLLFSRAETAAICAALELPVWLDASNHDVRFSRNRVRAEVLPVLEQLHPGATQRLAATAERLAAQEEGEGELLELALQGLGTRGSVAAGGGATAKALARRELPRQPLMALEPANQRRLLHHWLRRHGGMALGARQLELLRQRLAPGQPPGSMALAGGWQLRWDRCTLQLQNPQP